MTRTAACSCAQLTVTMTGEPHFIAACSCLECRKGSGSVAAVSSYWPNSAALSLSGKSTSWHRGSWKGGRIDNHFCPACGSTLFWYAEFAPDSNGISVGIFCDSGFPPPTYAVWCERRHP